MAAPAPESLEEISVYLPTELVNYLFTESERMGIRPADLLQQAIVNYRFLLERAQAGASVLLDEKGKSLQKVELPTS